MLMKKLAISFGSLIVVTVPVITAISCSSGDGTNPGSIWEFGEYTPEQVDSLNTLPDQVWKDGEPKFMYSNNDPINGVKVLNPDFPGYVEPKSPEQLAQEAATAEAERREAALAAIQGNVKDTDGDWKYLIAFDGNGLQFNNPDYDTLDLPASTGAQQEIHVVEDVHIGATQQDISRWPYLSFSEKATIQGWSDEQYNQFTRLIAGESVHFSSGLDVTVGPKPIMDDSTEQSIVERAFDIVVSNGQVPLPPLRWRALVSLPVSQPPAITTPGPTAPTSPQTPPPLPTGNQGPTAPGPVMPTPSELALLTQFNVSGSSKLSVPRDLANAGDTSTWTDAERALYRWYTQPTPPGQPPFMITKQKIDDKIRAEAGPASAQYISA